MSLISTLSLVSSGTNEHDKVQGMRQACRHHAVHCQLMFSGAADCVLAIPSQAAFAALVGHGLEACVSTKLDVVNLHRAED